MGCHLTETFVLSMHAILDRSPGPHTVALSYVDIIKLIIIIFKPPPPVGAGGGYMFSGRPSGPLSVRACVRASVRP